MAAIHEIPRTDATAADRAAKSTSAATDAAAERAARATLRAQIARLERALTSVTYSPRLAAAIAPAAEPGRGRVDVAIRRQLDQDPKIGDAPGEAPDTPRKCSKFVPGPRLLSIGELERTRDDLAAHLSTTRAAAEQQASHHTQARAELERMLADPPAHKWRRLSNADLGRPGCTTYHVRPKAGVLGLLMGWWEVKVSGGCPLGGPVRKYDAFRRARPASAGTRQAHTYHQYASACRAPADTTRTPPGYAPYLRTEPLAA